MEPMDTSSAGQENFFDRDKELAKLDFDVRVERIRQSSLRYSFDHFQQILRKGMREKKVDMKQEERVDLQKAIACLKQCQVDELGEGSIDGGNGSYVLYNATKELGHILGCEFDARGNVLVLKNEDFVMEVTTEGPLVVQCNTSWFNANVGNSSLLKNHMNEGRWKEISAGLQKVLQVIPRHLSLRVKNVAQSNSAQNKPFDLIFDKFVHLLSLKAWMPNKRKEENEKLKVVFDLPLSTHNKDNFERDQRRLCMTTLSHVENDIHQLSTMPLQDWNLNEKYAFEHCHPRTDLYPFTVLLGIEPFMQQTVTQIKDAVKVQESVLYSLHLCMAPHNDIVNLPMDSLFVDQSQWKDLTMVQTTQLPVVFCLKLSRPMVLLKRCYDALKTLDLVEIRVKEQVNLYRYLASVAGIKNLHSTLAPELIQLFDLDTTMLEKSEDVVATEFTFVHPKDVGKLVKLLRDQLIFNNLFESLCRVEPYESQRTWKGEQVLQVRVESEKGLSYDLFFDYGDAVVATHLRIAHGKIKTTFDSAFDQPLPDNFNQRMQDVANKTWSIPIFLHTVVTQLKPIFGDLLNKSASNISGLLSNNSMDADEDDRIYRNGRVGASWKRVFEMNRTPKVKTEVNYSFVADTQSDRRIANAKKRKNGSLLSILREVEEFEELIPPKEQPATTRPIVIPRMSTDLASRTVRSSTDTTNYQHAFSDLEAIAEMGASLDETESVISEQSGRSSITGERFSPSGAVDRYRTFSSIDTSDGSHMRSSSSTSLPAPQISPMDAQKQIPGIYRQRFMQPGMPQQNMGKGADVFDFVPDDTRMNQFAGMPSPFDDQNPAQFNMPMGPASASFVQGSGYSPMSSSTIPNSAPITGSNMNPMYIQPKRRGRARKVGNMGDRQPSGEEPNSPSIADQMMNVNMAMMAKKQRGGTGVRRPRRPRKTSSIIGEQNFSYQMNEADRPLLQRSFSEMTANFKQPGEYEPKVLTEYDMMDESSEDEETDPPPPWKLQQQIQQQQAQQAAAAAASQQQALSQQKGSITPKSELPTTTAEQSKAIQSSAEPTAVKKLSLAYSNSSASNKTTPSPPVMTDFSSSRGQGTAQKPSQTPTTVSSEIEYKPTIPTPATTTKPSAMPVPRKPIKDERPEKIKETIQVQPKREAPIKNIQALRQSISKSSDEPSDDSDEEEFGSSSIPTLKPAVTVETKIRKPSVSEATATAPSMTANSSKPAKQTTLDFNDLFTNEVDPDLRKTLVKKKEKPAPTPTTEATTASPTSGFKISLNLKLPKPKPSSSSSKSASTPSEPVRLSAGAPPSKKAASFKTSDRQPSSSVKHRSTSSTEEPKRPSKRKTDPRSSISSMKEPKIPKKSSAAEPPPPPPPSSNPTNVLGFSVGLASLKNFKIPKVQEETKVESPVTTAPPSTSTTASSSQDSRPEPRDNPRSSQSGHFQGGQGFPFNSQPNSSANFNIRRPPRSILKNSGGHSSGHGSDFGSGNMPSQHGPPGYRGAPSGQHRPPKPYAQEPPSSKGRYQGQPPMARAPFNPPPPQREPPGKTNWMPISTPSFQSSSKDHQRVGFFSHPVSDRDRPDPYSREVKDDSPSEQLLIDEGE